MEPETSLLCWQEPVTVPAFYFPQANVTKTHDTEKYSAIHVDYLFIIYPVTTAW